MRLTHLRVEWGGLEEKLVDTGKHGVAIVSLRGCWLWVGRQVPGQFLLRDHVGVVWGC